MSRRKDDDDPASPFPAVDDPLLAATLARVTGAAASLSSARTAGPAAAHDAPATVVVDDRSLLVDDDADPLSSPVRVTDRAPPAQAASAPAASRQGTSAPAATTPHAAPVPMRTAQGNPAPPASLLVTSALAASTHVASAPAASTHGTLEITGGPAPDVTPAKAGVQALPSPPPDRTMTRAGSGNGNANGGNDGNDGDDDDGNDGNDSNDGGDGDRPLRPRGPRRSPLALLVVALAVLAVLGIGALILLGRVNTTHYYLACEPERVVAERGRGFPPWGAHPLEGKQWSPIKIPPETECVPRETDNPDELGDWYRAILVDRAGALLTAREVTAVEDAASLLQQALLHARSDARRSERQDIERLLGDVDYWRATAKLRAAATALTDAAKQFDAAAAQRPRHVADAAAWAAHVRALATDLVAGPGGAHPSALPPPSAVAGPTRPPAPPGTILPVDPLAPATASAGAATAPAPPSPPPTGGVLL